MREDRSHAACTVNEQWMEFQQTQGKRLTQPLLFFLFFPGAVNFLLLRSEGRHTTQWFAGTQTICTVGRQLLIQLCAFCFPRNHFVAYLFYCFGGIPNNYLTIRKYCFSGNKTESANNTLITYHHIIHHHTVHANERITTNSCAVYNS